MSMDLPQTPFLPNPAIPFSNLSHTVSIDLDCRPMIKNRRERRSIYLLSGKFLAVLIYAFVFIEITDGKRYFGFEIYMITRKI